MSEPTRTMLAEVVLDLPPHLAAVAGERIAHVIRTICDVGLPVEANAERLATMRERLAAAIMRTVRMTGRAKIGIAYRLVDVLVAMESAGLCVTCGAALPARFTLSGSDGWGRCASCPGPCDATHERCNRPSGHKETCSPYQDRVQFIEIDLEHGKDGAR